MITRTSYVIVIMIIFFLTDVQSLEKLHDSRQELCIPKTFPTEGKCIERQRMDVYIASGGGTGSNFLFNFLCKQGLSLGSRTLDYGARWCHSLDPVTPDVATSHGIKRAIFLYSSNPLLQIRSMYRQGYAEVNFRKKIGLPANGPPTFPQNMNKYCNQSYDLVYMEAQWDAWVSLSIHSAVSYPILALNFESMWKYIPELLQYLGLPHSLSSKFPQQTVRRTVEEHHKGCLKIYESLIRKIRNTPEFLIIWDGKVYHDVECFMESYAKPPKYAPSQRSCNSSHYNEKRPYYHLYIK